MNEFEKLQQKLPLMWRQFIGTTLHDLSEVENTVVVVPSLSVEVDFPPSALQAYEERLLFLLFLLQKPTIRMIFITSQIIQTDIIDYYLAFLPGVIASSARQRLMLVSPQDGSARPLTQKLLDRPALLAAIRRLIPDTERAHIVPFNTTDLERELALKLGIPMYAADPRFFAFGTKSGCRRLFVEEGIQHPLGFENLSSVDAVVEAIAQIRARQPAVLRVVIKLNEGVGGLGNTVVDLAGLPSPGSPDESEAIRERLRGASYETSYADYVDKLARKGAIVEAYITGAEVRSPSAQLRVTPLGEVEMLSTHDQMLGGPSGQNYLGALFPADPAYSWTIMRDAAAVGRRLAQEGIVGRFALDFVAVRTGDGAWDTYAIEINLRKGGTTAPFLILQYLTDGYYDAETGVFTTSSGHAKYYVASDHVESPAYRVFTTRDLFEIVSNRRLHFNPCAQTGVIMHMITGVGELGRVGVTAIHNSPEEAQALYHRFTDALDREAAALLDAR